MRKFFIIVATTLALTGCGSIKGFLLPSVMNEVQNPMSIVCERDYNQPESCIQAAKIPDAVAQ